MASWPRAAPSRHRAAAAAALLASCSRAGGGVLPKPPRKVAFEVENRYPHDPTCFTEGIFLNESGPVVYESCGLYDQSDIRKYVLSTGQILQKTRLSKEIFAEGFAQLGGSLFALTYKERVIIEYDLATFKELRRHPFLDGRKQGWGLTTDGCDLLATTGDSYIYRFSRSPEGALHSTGKVKVRLAGVAVMSLNELEYVTPKIWVHKWITNKVYRVDPASGEVEAVMDIGSLYQWHAHSRDATPNGIAYSTRLDPGLLLVTGKLWPQMFALRVPPEDLCGGPAAASSAPRCPTPPESACWASAGAATAAAAAAGPAKAGEAATAPGAPAVLPEWEPVPELLTRAATVLGIALAVASVAVPVHIGRKRCRYKLLQQQAGRGGGGEPGPVQLGARQL